MEQLVCEQCLDIVNTLLYFHAAVTPLPHRLISTSAIRLALLHENSSNPVVSTVAASVLSIATQQIPSRVESVRKRLVETAWLHVLCSYTLQCCAVVVRQCEGSNRLGNMKGQLTIFVTVKLQSARVCTRVY